MENTTRLAFIAAGCLLISGQAMAYMIDDAEFGANTYWGGKDHLNSSDVSKYGDVIGLSSKFDIMGMDVFLNGSTLTVDIFTNFAGRGDDRSYNTLTRTAASGYDGVDANTSMGIGYGDLFLASAWAPEGSNAHNSLDDNVTGTLWEYGLALDDHWSTNGGNVTLYKLNGGTNDANALLTDDFLSGGTFRNGQEVAVDLTADISNVGAGTWTVNDGYLEFVFDISGTTGLLDNGELGLHWAMSCGNDTIEGKWNVPEPTTLSLMGLSLLGIGFIGRRKRMQ